MTKRFKSITLDVQLPADWPTYPADSFMGQMAVFNEIRREWYRVACQVMYEKLLEKMAEEQPSESFFAESLAPNLPYP